MVEDILKEDSRYSRQRAIPVFGDRSQSELAKASVAIVGAGGVKSTLLLMLAAAGVGRIKIYDFDRVELSNLNRQIIYKTSDIGKLKAEAAADALRSLNNEICVEWSATRIGNNNYDDFLSGFDLIIEGGDGAEARLAFNQWAVQTETPYIHASAQYNYSYIMSYERGSACMQCAYPDMEAGPGGAVPVIGTATGLAGVAAANEAINYLIGRGFNYAGKIWCHQGWSGDTIYIPIAPNPNCPACGHHRTTAKAYVP